MASATDVNAYSGLGAISTSRTSIIIGGVAAYVTLCRLLRYGRRDREHSQRSYHDVDSFQKMSGEDAWKIIKYITSCEFPFTSEKALSFALFKTYGIPTISKLLCETQQLGKAEYAGRRYTDTSLLITEFIANSPTSERANSAIARMNYLHGRYQKAKKISNDDMLYTLSLFVLEVEKWIGLYEWRSLTPMEICAFGTHWKAVGDAMGIDYAALRHGPHAFKHGYEFFQDLKEWADNYEKKNMVPDKFNHQLAEETTRVLLVDVPDVLRPYGEKVVVALMDDRLRRAMMYEKPPSLYPKLVKVVFGVRRFILRNLMPPRPDALRVKFFTDEKDPKTGKYHMTVYQKEPWYVKPSFAARNSPWAWLRWAVGKPYPNGKDYRPQGYSIFEIGPEKLVGKGIEECEATKNELMKSDRGRCPFAFS